METTAYLERIVGYSRPFHEFQKLMNYRVHEVLLVSSLYDSFILEEDGHLYEMILTEYIDLNLSHAPGITRVSSGTDAIRLAREEKRFDLIITTMNLGDMDALKFARLARESGLDLPLILLLYDKRELRELKEVEHGIFEKVFIWQGDFRIMIAIIKYIEDQMNVEADTKLIGVQSIILVEDNVNFYSSYLPMIYTEVLKHHQSLLSDSMNMAHKLLRMRARPKILLCSTYEQAMDYYKTFEDCVLGVISDVEFPRKGEKDKKAGIRLAREIKSLHFDIPIILQSNSEEYAKIAHSLGVSFVLKTSPSLLGDVREFMKQYFSFGDFVFCMPDQTSVGQASSLRELERELKRIPDESLQYHSERNHFSRWLKARTEFWLAHKLRPQKVSDYKSLTELREHLINSLRQFRRQQGRGLTSDFDAQTFDPTSSFARIGGGSLGGKARGLAFMNSLLTSYQISDKFERVQIAVPPAVVLGTDVFDQFLDNNNLRDFALRSNDDDTLIQRFRDSSLPPEVTVKLREYLDMVHYPLAVRSSSLLEDSRYQPFAGIYETYMIPNSHHDIEVRLQELTYAIKRVYASTYSNVSKGYIRATSYRLEEEKMAIIVQRMAGQKRGNRYYPSFSGVGRTHNYYPSPPMVAADGIVSVALGLGKMVAEGELAIRFCPRYPRHMIQFSDIKSTLDNSQKWFYAVELEDPDDDSDHTREMQLQKYDLTVAEKDGTLAAVASTFSPENNAIYDGISRPGVRLVTFAPLLKGSIFPLAEIVQTMMDLGRWGINSPIEIEFAVNHNGTNAVEFSFLQIRPLVTSSETEEVLFDDVPADQIIVQSNQVLGHGINREIRHIVVVDPETFDRARSREVAVEVGQFNAQLAEDNTPYLLIGVGRWGSADPWLGIPVTWDQINGARVIIETGFKDFTVVPSQGSHFFQNLTSFSIGYFTVNSHIKEGIVDWDWLDSLQKLDKKEFTYLAVTDTPIEIRMNGHSNMGAVLKP